jgi:hypothetical protein
LTTQEIRYVGAASCGPRLAPLLEALLAIEETDHSISDPDITADIGSGFVDVEITVDAEDPVAAVGKAHATLRAAVHAVEGTTPDWETATAAIHIAPADASDGQLLAS